MEGKIYSPEKGKFVSIKTGKLVSTYGQTG